jgi:hypothetical protein
MAAAKGSVWLDTLDTLLHDADVEVTAGLLDNYLHFLKTYFAPAVPSPLATVELWVVRSNPFE